MRAIRVKANSLLAYGKRALGTVLRAAIDQDFVSAEYYQGVWLDIGTPERLAQLDQSLNAAVHAMLPTLKRHLRE